MLGLRAIVCYNFPFTLQLDENILEEKSSNLWQSLLFNSPRSDRLSTAGERELYEVSLLPLHLAACLECGFHTWTLG